MKAVVIKQLRTKVLMKVKSLSRSIHFSKLHVFVCLNCFALVCNVIAICQSNGCLKC